MNLLPVKIDAAATVDALGTAVDKIFTSDDERASAAIVLERLRQQPAALQVELNKIEAAHASVFVAGWRPGIGWVCATSLLYAFLLQPILQSIISILGVTACGVVFDPAAGGEAVECGKPLILPTLDVAQIIALTLAMLGMAKLRSDEKKAAVA